jgi:hypothetical protein
VTDLRPRRQGVPLPPSGQRRPRSRLARWIAPLGPAGRVGATALLLAPLWWFATTDTVGVVGLPIWVFFVLPKSLRDIWRSGPAQPRQRRFSIGGRGPRAGDGGESDSIAHRAGPTRW